METPIRIAGLVALTVAGCIATPQPEPTPVEAGRVSLSAPDGSDRVTVAAGPGAAAGAEAAVLRNPARGATTTALVSSDGSFAATIEAAAGDAIAVALRAGGAESEERSLPVPAPTLAAPTLVRGLPPAGADGSLQLVGSIEAGAPPLVVVAADLDSLAVASWTAEADGSFSVVFDASAETGDTVSIFARDAEDPTRVGPPLTGAVPP